MKFPILVVKNKINYDISDDLNKFKAWFSRTPLEPEFYFLDTEFSGLTVKVFKDNWYGLDGIKPMVRGTGKILQHAFKAVIFFYELGDTDWKPGMGVLGAWTYYNDLNGAVFIEIPSKLAWEQSDNLYRILTHEIIHAFHRICWWSGYVTDDSMDLYDKEWEVEAPDGNRARNLAYLTANNLWGTVGATSLFWRVFQALAALIPVLQRKIEELKALKEQELKVEKVEKGLVERFCELIKTYEGWYEGSLTYRLNNPGALRWSPFQNETKGGFAYFNTYNDGWRALIHQVTIAGNGESSVYSPEDTILDFFRKYSPPSDGNDPSAYAEWVAHELNLELTTKIKELL